MENITVQYFNFWFCFFPPKNSIEFNLVSTSSQKRGFIKQKKPNNLLFHPKDPFNLSVYLDLNDFILITARCLPLQTWASQHSYRAVQSGEAAAAAAAAMVLGIRVISCQITVKIVTVTVTRPKY